MAAVEIVPPRSARLRAVPVIAPVMLMVPSLVALSVSRVRVVPTALLRVTAPVIVTLFPAMSPVTMSPLRVAVVAVSATEAISSPAPMAPTLSVVAPAFSVTVSHDVPRMPAVAAIAPPAVLTARFEPSANCSVPVAKVTASAVLVKVVGAPALMSRVVPAARCRSARWRCT